MTSPIKDVSDTAFWIAHHRALETQRRDALFRDPLAAVLAGEHGRAISQAMPTSRVVAWTVAIRTRIIDEFIQFALDAGVDTVLNLGAGLDTRPYRMNLPASLRWIEADYAHLIEYKESKLQGHEPHCRLERVKIDLGDLPKRRELLDRVNAQSSGILVLTEGVIPYLSNEDVSALAIELKGMSQVRFWIADYFSAASLEYRRRRRRIARGMRNAPFKFAPGDWFEFFKHRGWEASQVRYIPEEAWRLRRPIPLPWHMKIFLRVMRPFMSEQRKEAFRKFAGYVLLKPMR
jgi:methyltransferase (TIGR00027 family)